jgi:hypothetical protein
LSRRFHFKSVHCKHRANPGSLSFLARDRVESAGCVGYLSKKMSSERRRGAITTPETQCKTASDLAVPHPVHVGAMMISDATRTEADNRDWTPRHEQGPWMANEIAGFDFNGIIRATNLNGDDPIRHEPCDAVRMLVAPVLYPWLKSAAGVIVNAASAAGLGWVPNSTPYGMAKAGLIQITRSLAVANEGLD